ncbi:hypothetical protein [Pedobacter mendelii]|uniref:hypothetical protein n=1 Tax=Pedobacter mendelii TaxID=1908240 RepID=UPI001669B050|nr:hypothetical protein [Pedobacter mendelii]
MFGSPPPRGSFFFLDKKEAKNQGLELMSAILVETFIAAAQAPDEKSGRTRCLVQQYFNVSAKVSTGNPSISSYAG